ncbi:MAG: RIP metalloprotease RseP [Candidatus Omnitrophota bacterium]
MLGLLIFLIVISILIVVHELGHFLTAKSLGIRVERFAVGFGPKLVSKVFRGTEFALCLIPVGGYVKMAGDERSQCTGQKDEFFSHPPGHRALIVVFGPIVNYLMAFVCFWMIFVTGYPYLSNTIGEIREGYPAQEVGIQEGDMVIRIDSQKIKSFEDILKAVRTMKKDTLAFTVVRDGQEITKMVTPQIEILKNIFGQKEEIPLVGIMSTDEIVFIKYGPMESISKSFEQLYDITATTYKALYFIATGAMSAKKSLTGPLGIYKIIQDAASQGLSYVILIMAVVSASLAIFNLLPLPILDGGHLFFLAIEKIRGKALSVKADEMINRIGFSLIICLAVFVFYNDFSRFGWIDKLVGFWQDLKP